MSDQPQVFDMLRDKAQKGDAQAQWAWGLCHFLGMGVAKDYAEAYKWYLLAETQHDPSAKNSIPKAEHVMSREQIAEGKQRAREFKPQVIPCGRRSQ